MKCHGIVKRASTNGGIGIQKTDIGIFTIYTPCKILPSISHLQAKKRKCNEKNLNCIERFKIIMTSVCREIAGELGN